MKGGKLKEKTRFFENVLLDFFRKAGRAHLPWRREGISAYEVWVSEIMLQQTQVSRVISYYEKFLARFPNVETLAAASWEEFLPYYAGLGYYARGRNMLRAAKMVVEDFGGVFPRDVRELEALPGIGSYTASAIASFAYGENAIAWDTNVRRVIGRYFVGTKNFQFSISNFQSNSTLQSSISKQKGRSNEGETLEIEDWKLEIEKKFSLHAKTLNAALMDFGSAMCTGRPKCGACPLSGRCVYFREKGKRELGIKKKELDKEKETRKKTWRETRVEVTLHENHQRYFSSVHNSYKPFLLPASHNTRAGIKSWFRERYGLDVSVRPPHEKIMRNGRAMILVNVQILAGTHSFESFPKSAARGC